MTNHILMKEKLELKNNLEKIRKRLNLSQREVSTRVGITIDSYYRIERGLACPNIKTAFAISKALSTRIDKLFYITVYAKQ